MPDLPSFLRANSLRLKKGLGQHFLNDPDVLNAIINAANITENDHIVEIGPGIGVLTKELLKHAKKVTAIEIDQVLIALLHEYLQQDTSHELTVINADALETPFPTEPYKIVANIPYQITSPLLRHALLESAQRPSSLTLLLQREVAEKICEKKNVSLLSMLVGLFGTPEILRIVPPSAFIPPPKVDSAVLHIACFPEPRANKETITELFRLAKIAFGGKRKMLRGTIGKLPDGMEKLAKAGIDPTKRPQAITLEEWIHLAKPNT